MALSKISVLKAVGDNTRPSSYPSYLSIFLALTVHCRHTDIPWSSDPICKMSLALTEALIHSTICMQCNFCYDAAGLTPMLFCGL